MKNGFSASKMILFCGLKKWHHAAAQRLRGGRGGFFSQRRRGAKFFSTRSEQFSLEIKIGGVHQGIFFGDL